MYQFVMQLYIMIHTVSHAYISFGLIGSNTVEDHIKRARQKTTLTRRACHGERLSTSRYSICEKQTCNSQTNESTNCLTGMTATGLLMSRNVHNF